MASAWGRSLIFYARTWPVVNIWIRRWNRINMQAFELRMVEIFVAILLHLDGVLKVYIMCTTIYSRKCFHKTLSLFYGLLFEELYLFLIQLDCGNISCISNVCPYRVTKFRVLLYKNVLKNVLIKPSLFYVCYPFE